MTDMQLRKGSIRKDLITVAKLGHMSWSELEHGSSGYNFSPDWDLYSRLEDMGLLTVYFMVVDSMPCGVCVCMNTPSLHYKGVKVTHIDMVYISPEHRGVGEQFLGEVFSVLKECGTDTVVLSLPPRYRSSSLPTRLGMVEGDTHYSVRLN